MEKKIAIVTGIAGQDGSYLAELLLEKNYHVVGIKRRSSSDNAERIAHLLGRPDFEVIEGDITDPSNVNSWFHNYQPDEFYNLAAQSVTEESILPIRSGNIIKHVTFGKLWQEQLNKGKKPEIEQGYIEVINLPSTQNSMQALGYWNGMGTWFNITQISRHRWNDKVVRLSQKFGSVCVTPNHSILDTNQKVCRPKENPWLLNVRKLNTQPIKQLKNLTMSFRGRSIKEDGFIWKNEQGNIGKVKHKLSLNEINALCEFIGAFVAEGHTSFNKANNTYTVNISEQSKDWLKYLEQCLDKFFVGNRCYCVHKKDGYRNVHRLEIKSKYLYYLLREWCGIDSKSKQLPPWFTKLSTDQLRLVFDKMIDGDGSIGSNGWRYTTSSYKLACQFSFLITLLGFDYTVHENHDEQYGYSWGFRQCKSYQPTQGEKSKKIEYLDYDGWVYDITVEEVNNFTVGIGNIVVHNSHVGTSFTQPSLTWNVNAMGVMNIVEAIKNYSPSTRMYQASTSEMFGSNMSWEFRINDNNPYQDENTPFCPESPYAIAKVAAHQTIGLYRKAYNLHLNAGILFNHETLTYNTPIIIKNGDGLINILPIGDVARFYAGVDIDINKKEYQAGFPKNDLWVWDQNGWTKVKYVSGYPHKQSDNKNPRIVNSRNSVYAATGSHVCIMEDDSEKETSDLKIGDKIKLSPFPNANIGTDVNLQFAEWLGMMVGDGNIDKGIPRFTNKSMKVKQKFINLWNSFTTNPYHRFIDTESGFSEESIGQVKCYSDNIPPEMFDIYSEGDISPFGHMNKKIPHCILNASVDVMEAFLVGYNACDGLKSNPCVYRFKNFKTNSHTLAAGLVYLISKVTQQKYNITVEESWKWGKQQFYYSINLLSDKESPLDKYNIVKPMLDKHISQREIHRRTGISRTFIRKVYHGYIPSHTHHLEKPSNEVKKIIDIPNYDGWFFDLETESGTFHAGAGQGVVHNSPRRGPQFVTRKITKWVGEFCAFFAGYGRPIFPAQQDYIERSDGRHFPKLRLGNLEAKRDWGHARDYVEAMWLMLQQEQPDDYVVATGNTYSVRDFLAETFHVLEIDDYMDYIVQDPKFMRPSEVPYLRGKPTIIKENLGWKPKTSFAALVREMVLYDIKEAKKRNAGLE